MSIHACWCHPITNAGNVLPQVWNQDNNDYVRYKSNGTSIFSISSKEHFQISNWRRVHCAVQAWGWVELLRGSVAILVSTRMQLDLKSQTFVKQMSLVPVGIQLFSPFVSQKLFQSVYLFVNKKILAGQVSSYFQAVCPHFWDALESRRDHCPWLTEEWYLKSPHPSSLSSNSVIPHNADHADNAGRYYCADHDNHIWRDWSADKGRV